MRRAGEYLDVLDPRNLASYLAGMGVEALVGLGLAAIGLAVAAAGLAVASALRLAWG